MLKTENHVSARVIRLAHGPANAFDTELCLALAEAFQQAPGRPIVLIADGPIFSAGVDLKRLQAGGDSYTSRFLDALIALFQEVQRREAPVVAAVNGHAIAGGAVLACAADYRVMADGPGRIGVPELQVGVPFPTRAREIMARRANPAYHARLFLRGETLRGGDLVTSGLVDEVVPLARLEDRAVEVAGELGSIPSSVYSLNKRQSQADLEAFLAAHEEALDREVREQWRSEECLAAVARYVKKHLGSDED